MGAPAVSVGGGGKYEHRQVDEAARSDTAYVCVSWGS